MEEIGRGTFFGQSNIKEVYLPASLTEFGNNVYLGISSWCDIYVKKGSPAETYYLDAQHIGKCTLKYY